MVNKFLVFISIALAIVVGFLITQHREPIIVTETTTMVDTVIVSRIDTIRVVQEINATITKIIIDTVVMDTIASIDTVFVEEQVATELKIKYFYSDMKFKIDLKNKIKIDSILVTKEIIRIQTAPPRKLRYVTSAGIWASEGEYSMSLGAGIRIYDKIDLLLTANTNKQIGLICGYAF